MASTIYCSKGSARTSVLPITLLQTHAPIDTVTRYIAANIVLPISELSRTWLQMHALKYYDRHYTLQQT